MGKLVFLNGKLVPAEQASISVYDHGLLYGDGVFEGIRAYNGRVFKLDEHVDRLYNSAKIIMLEPPVSKEEMKKAIVYTCKENGIQDGYIRPVITRGTGTLGLAPWLCEKASYFVIVDRIKLYPDELYENGMPIITVSARRNIPTALNPIVKSLNYLNNIMAKIEAHVAGFEEAIMLNHEGYVAECTGDNIFIINKGRMWTPPVATGALQGITRDTIIDLAKEMGVEVSERNFTLAEMYIADEAFLTGTAAEALAVVKVDGRTVGDGKPGPITRKLIAKFKEYASSHGTPIE